MIYKYYLSLPLAIGITLLSTTSGLSKVLVNRNYKQFPLDSVFLVANQAITENSPSTTTTAQAETSSYLGLMNAGYTANQKQDYLAALNYFRQALSLQPGDLLAQKAIKNITSYGFDVYMRTGYAADKVRDYTTALQNFQKALQIRPDSWHAKQAASNVTYYLNYLAQQPVDSNSSNDQNQGNGFNLWLMLITIAIASGLSAVLLFYLFKKTGSSLQKPELENLESLDGMNAQSKLEDDRNENSEITLENSQPELTNAESPLKSLAPNSPENAEQPQTPPLNESNEVEQSNSNTSSNNSESTSLVGSGNSLAKLDIVPELIQDLAAGDRSLRRKAVWELAQRGDSRAMKPLVELMVEVDSQERGLVLEAMTQIAGRTLKPMNKAIMMSLQDENTQVKQNAIRDLTRVYELMSQVTKRLSEAAEDSDAQVQETAKWALQKLNQMPANSTWQTDPLANEINSFNSSNGANGTTHHPKDKNYPLS